MRISDWSSDVCSSDLCLLIVGVDEYDNIWLLDCFWKRTKTDEVVDAMIHMMRKWRPMFWWAEGGHISKSIGPFLFKRMREEKRSEEHTSELQSLMRISYAVFCLKKKKTYDTL